MVETSRLEGIRRIDATIAYALFGCFFLLLIILAFDFPHPDPDFYVYLDQARDIAAFKQTDQKFAPGFPLLLSPFAGFSASTAEIVGRCIGLGSYLIFGFAMIGILRRLNLIGISLAVVAILGSRYVMITSLSATSHLPFAAMTASTFWAILSRKWTWAYITAALALSFRYNGLLLPFFVMISHFLSNDESRKAFKKIAPPVLFCVLGILPTALYMQFGTEVGVSRYREEVEARGTAGLQVVQYMAAGIGVSFMDSVGSKAISKGDTSMKVLFGIAILPLLAMSILGVYFLWKSQRFFCLWLAIWLAWWVVVHSRFADVGGIYFYTTQITWAIWTLVAAGLSYLVVSKPFALYSIFIPFVLLWMDSRLSIFLALGITALAFPFVRSFSKTAMPIFLATFALLPLSFVNAKEKIYENNPRPVIEAFLDWSKSHPKILVSPFMLDQWKAAGLDVSNLVSEEYIDGSDIMNSIKKLGVRYAAVTSWEMDYRTEEEFIEGHEFFLGKRYPTSLRPYDLLLNAYRERGWKKVQEFKVRNAAIFVYEPIHFSSENR
ncbi:MAG TPA: hypothetical protein VNK96_07180 [Fimbriimonadales bacterium]|nr:hypothetical protein [Fimbriimonadales bacterium]